MGAPWWIVGIVIGGLFIIGGIVIGGFSSVDETFQKVADATFILGFLIIIITIIIIGVILRRG